jgi:Pyridoxamine 5'-phosphate oxidase
MTTETTPLVIPEEVALRVNEARNAGKPLVLCYIASDGRPVASVRGSVHVHGDGQLAMWVRHAKGDLAQSIVENPYVTLLYRDNEARTTFTLNGRARLDDDEAVRARVYDESPEGEADAHDPDHNGAAMIIDLDSIEGGTVGVKGPQVSVRASADTRIWSALYPQA